MLGESQIPTDLIVWQLLKRISVNGMLIRFQERLSAVPVRCERTAHRVTSRCCIARSFPLNKFCRTDYMFESSRDQVWKHIGLSGRDDAWRSSIARSRFESCLGLNALHIVVHPSNPNWFAWFRDAVSTHGSNPVVVTRGIGCPLDENCICVIRRRLNRQPQNTGSGDRRDRPATLVIRFDRTGVST